MISCHDEMTYSDGGTRLETCVKSDLNPNIATLRAAKDDLICGLRDVLEFQGNAYSGASKGNWVTDLLAVLKEPDDDLLRIDSARDL
jgi:hypothetical protein